MHKRIILLTILLLASSCNDGFKNDQQAKKPLKKIWSGFFVEDFSDTKSVDVFVVTNRKSSGGFGCDQSSFGVTTNNALSFGACKISIPKNHNTGEITFTKDNKQSSNNYFKILAAKNMEEKELINFLGNNNRTPLVFVHGFNVSFFEAVLRASQIAYDLKYQGPVVLFTWPAGAKDGFFSDAMLNKTYENNLTNAKETIPLFKNFLSDLQKNDIKINLMVHSMGHQVVLPSLKELGNANSKQPLINELILNAPDFDAIEFKSFTKNIKKISDRITLYCSYNDKAMLASKTFNNNERLGACSFIDDVDIINVGLIDNPTLGLGHGYYSSRIVLTDVFQTLLGIDAPKRLFIKKSEPNSAEKYFLRM